MTDTPDALRELLAMHDSAIAHMRGVNVAPDYCDKWVKYRERAAYALPHLAATLTARIAALQAERNAVRACRTETADGWSWDITALNRALGVNKRQPGGHWNAALTGEAGDQNDSDRWFELLAESQRHSEALRRINAELAEIEDRLATTPQEQARYDEG